MHPRSNDRPTQAQLVFPLLEVLHEAGGKAKAVDVAEALADRFDISREMREQVAYDTNGDREPLPSNTDSRRMPDHEPDDFGRPNHRP